MAASEERGAELVRKKEASIMKTYDEPVLPTLCKIIFRGMIILEVAMLLVDLNAFLRYGRQLGIGHLFSNIATTGFLCWLSCSVFLIPLCGLAVKQTNRRFWKKKADSGIEDVTDEDRNRSRRALTRLNRFYVKYLKIDIVGLVIWGLIYLIAVL